MDELVGAGMARWTGARASSQLPKALARNVPKAPQNIARGARRGRRVPGAPAEVGGVGQDERVARHRKAGWVELFCGDLRPSDVKVPAEAKPPLKPH